MLELKRLNDGIFSSIIYCIIWGIMLAGLLIAPASPTALWVALLLFGGSVLGEFATSYRHIHQIYIMIINLIGALIGFLILGFAFLGLLNVFSLSSIDVSGYVLTLSNGSNALVMSFSFNMMVLYWVFISLPICLCFVRLIVLYIFKLMGVKSNSEPIAEDA